MTERLKYETCKYCDKPRVAKDVEAKETPTSINHDEDKSEIDHRIVLFGWRLRLASGKNRYLTSFRRDN